MKANLPFLVLPIADRVEEELLLRVREGGGAALGLGLLTIRDLETRLFAAAGLRPLAPLGAELLVGELAPTASQGTTLGKVAAEPGFPRAFLSVWNALREGGCGLEELPRLIERVEGLTRRRLSAIHQIASAYEGACGRLGVVDAWGGRLALLGALPTLDLPPDLARAEALVIEDVVDLPPVRLRLLAGLAHRGIRVILRLPAFEGRAGLAASMELLLQAAEAEGRGIEIAWKKMDRGALGPFQRRLFDPDGAVADDAPVQTIEADGPHSELRAAAAEARKRIDQGVPPDDIWIATRNLSNVRQGLARSLDDLGVPWRDRRGSAALDAPPLRLVLAILEGAERHWPRQQLAALLTSRYVAGAVPAEEGAPFIPASELVEMLRAAASRDDRGEGHAKRLSLSALRLAASGDRKAPQVERASRHLEKLLAPLRLPGEATLEEHAARLVAGLEALGITAKSRARELPLGATGDHAGMEALEVAAASAIARDQAALRALSDWLASLLDAARQVGLQQKTFSLSHFRSLVEAGLGQLRLPVRGARGGAVRLVDVSELPGRRCAHLILVGVVDGSFPWRRSGEPLLEESDREAINLAAGRSIFRWRAPEEPLLFALSCQVPADSLVITTSRLDGDGRELIPSPFFEEAVAATGGKPPLRIEESVVPSPEACGNRQELLVRAALDSAGPAATRWADVPELATRIQQALQGAKTGFGLEPLDCQLQTDRALGSVSDRLAGSSHGAPSEVGGLPVAWRASVTAIEDYASCPFRFFARRLLDLPEAGATSDELDAREGGTLLHAVAAEVFEALRDEGLLPLEGGPRAAREKEVGVIAARKALDQWQEKERLGPTALWSLTRDQALRAVTRWLEAEVRQDRSLVPHEFEKAFGDEGEASLVLPSPDGKEAISLRGRIDRVDRSDDGSSVEVIDYKSGRVEDRVKAAELGRSQFQLPIYAVWARQTFDADGVDASLRSLRDGSSSRTLAAVCEKAEIPTGTLLETDPERRAATRNGAPVLPASGALELPVEGDPNVADAAWSFLFAMREGRFSVKPDGETVCGYCSYASVCRITETGGGR